MYKNDKEISERNNTISQSIENALSMPIANNETILNEFKNLIEQITKENCVLREEISFLKKSPQGTPVRDGRNMDL